MREMSDKLKELLAEPIQRAAAKIAPLNDEERTIELSFSSENPVEDWPGMMTILSHDAGAADFTRLNDGAPFLFNHKRDDVIGVIEKAEISDRKGRAVVRLGKSARAEEVYQDIKDGILRHISVGMRIREIRFDAEKDGVEIYKALKWEALEVSLVSVPADTTVGIHRDLKIHKKSNNRKMSDKNKATDSPTKDPIATVDIEAERAAGLNSERDRVTAINKAGDVYGCPELARQFVDEGKSIAEFKDAVLEEKNKSHNRAVKTGNEELGLSDKETRQYSFLKLLRHLSAPSDTKAREAAAFEIECAQGVKSDGKTDRGFAIPLDVLRKPLVDRADNVISIKTGVGYSGTGDNLVETSLLASSFIDLLRNRSFVLQHSTMLGNLVGEVDIPKELTAPVASWIGEDDEAPRNDATFGQIGLRNKTAAVRSAITRKLLKQSSIDVEALVRAGLAKALALEIDRAALYGSGSGNEPTGITENNGINAVIFGVDSAPTYAEIVEMETKVAADNADIGSMLYALAATMRGHLKTTQKFSGTNGAPVWEQNNTLNGYMTEVSNQVLNTDVIFGNFAQLYTGMWGGLELTVDPYSDSARGRINVNAFQDVDFAIGLPESFCLGRYTV